MSFILDALKKLEEKRHNESAPDLMTNHTEGNRKQVKRPLLTYLLIAVLLLNAVLLALWLRPQQKENNSYIAQVAKENIENPAPAASGSDEAAINKDTTTQASKENIENPAPAAPESDEVTIKKHTPPVQEVVEAAPAPDITVTENQEVAIDTTSLLINPSPEEISALKNRIVEEHFLVNASPSLEPAIEEESAHTAEGRVLDMSQLPLDIRKGLPELNIAGHIYSNDPMSRFVNINGNVIREGETVTAGLKVSEITMSGVIFDYEGVLFHIRAF